MLDEVTPLKNNYFRERLLKLGNPRSTLKRMHELIKDICKELHARVASIEGFPPPSPSPSPPLHVVDVTLSTVQEKEGNDNEDAFHGEKNKVPADGLLEFPKVTYISCFAEFCS